MSDWSESEPNNDSFPLDCACEPIGAAGVKMDCKWDRHRTSCAEPVPFTWQAPDVPFEASSVFRAPVPWPGLFGAVALAVAVVAVHIVGSALTAIALVVGIAISTGEIDAQVLVHEVAERSGAVLIAGEMAIFLAFAGVLTLGSFGSRIERSLGLAPLSASHFVLIVCLALPLSLACGRLHEWCLTVWDWIAPHVPFSSGFEHLDTTEAIRGLADSTSLPLLVLLLAVAPAIGEELIFRGIIGRGLVARWGTKMGVLLTSLLFAAVHLHPAHAVALIPLAVLMHVVYLATRTIWGPILLHFLNNGLAAVLLKTSDATLAGAVPDDASLPLGVAILAAVTAIAVARLIWQTRIQYRLPDGTEWTPGYDTAERPPRGIGAAVHRSLAQRDTALVAFASLTFFLSTLAFSLLAQTSGV